MELHVDFQCAQLSWDECKDICLQINDQEKWIYKYPENYNGACFIQRQDNIEIVVSSHDDVYILKRIPNKHSPDVLFHVRFDKFDLETFQTNLANAHTK